MDEEIKKMYPPSGRGQMRKIDIEPRIFNLKHELYNTQGASDDWYAGAHYSLNRVLQILQEYYS
ncbi:hypothetical protein CYXG_00163 [Synechococcus phage S-SSM4]|uniref:Uncharacterized protein n=1 Tax=Synechococcus phage S-SSM4 TaxID=536466 RepID=M1UG48_9CAUD|nr:hypothetical protein CYXG_00163 [Synechococcus phage S-SSM4]AGG54227.1 hypothetical protein CYXG_00163 [Synechococcus phage S-SSM4]AGG54415.1 hypothetical protein CYWG_00131 [Cyanophage S-SSM6b]